MFDKHTHRTWYLYMESFLSTYDTNLVGRGAAYFSLVELSKWKGKQGIHLFTNTSVEDLTLILAALRHGLAIWS